MRFAVLGRLDSWYVRDLQRAATDQHEIVPLPFSHLSGMIAAEEPAQTATSQGMRLDNSDAILVRAMAPGSLEQVVFRMDLLGRCEACGMIVVNPPRAVEAAVDKYLALAKLQQSNLKVPATIVCQTADDALQAFVRLGHDVVMKPLFGAEGRGITRITDIDLAERAFRMLEQMQAVIYLQEFVAHDNCDLRLLVIGRRVLGMKRTNPTDWRTNASRGAKCETFIVSDELVELALRAAAAVGASLAGVDVIVDRSGQAYVIEVNAAPGWKALARAHNLDVAQLVLEHLADLVQARQ
jgi:ribosomal protein S6--L-glutamate ligase